MIRRSIWRTARFAIPAMVYACSSDQGRPAALEDAEATRPDVDAGSPGPTVDAGVNSDTGAQAEASVNSVACDAYCTAMMTTCSETKRQYISIDQCLAECAFFPPSGGSPQAENSVNCRDHWVQTLGAEGCSAAGPSGGGTCGTRCDAFCKLTMGLCAAMGGAQPYPSESECNIACAAFRYDAGVDEYKSPMGNTLNCRQALLQEAFLGPEGATLYCENIANAGTPCAD